MLITIENGFTTKGGHLQQLKNHFITIYLSDDHSINGFIVKISFFQNHTPLSSCDYHRIKEFIVKISSVQNYTPLFSCDYHEIKEFIVKISSVQNYTPLSQFIMSAR